jgi:Glyoxalase-like domain
MPAIGSSDRGRRRGWHHLLRSVRVQVVIDCAGPHELVRFWAAALGLDVEDNSAMTDLAAEHVLEAQHDELPPLVGAAMRAKSATTPSGPVSSRAT